MSLDGQRIDPARYSVIPRTLTFLIRDRRVLLLKLGEQAAGWAGRYNGLGGHVERGEHPLAAAVREVREECGLEVPDTRLCGVVTVDTGSIPGIALYVFIGRLDPDPTAPHGPESEWIELDRLQQVPLVEDLPTLLPAAIHAEATRTVFSASYRYDSAGALHINLE